MPYCWFSSGTRLSQPALLEFVGQKGADLPEVSRLVRIQPLLFIGIEQAAIDERVVVGHEREGFQLQPLLAARMRRVLSNTQTPNF